MPDILAGWILGDTPLFARKNIRYTGGSGGDFPHEGNAAAEFSFGRDDVDDTKYSPACGVPMYTALERHMDHIATELNMDRREFRLKNLFNTGDGGVDQVAADHNKLNIIGVMSGDLPDTFSPETQKIRNMRNLAALWL